MSYDYGRAEDINPCQGFPGVCIYNPCRETLECHRRPEPPPANTFANCAYCGREIMHFGSDPEPHRWQHTGLFWPPCSMHENPRPPGAAEVVNDRMTARPPCQHCHKRIDEYPCPFCGWDDRLPRRSDPTISTHNPNHNEENGNA